MIPFTPNINTLSRDGRKYRVYRYHRMTVLVPAIRNGVTLQKKAGVRHG